MFMEISVRALVHVQGESFHLNWTRETLASPRHSRGCSVGRERIVAYLTVLMVMLYSRPSPPITKLTDSHYRVEGPTRI